MAFGERLDAPWSADWHAPREVPEDILSDQSPADKPLGTRRGSVPKSPVNLGNRGEVADARPTMESAVSRSTMRVAAPSKLNARTRLPAEGRGFESYHPLFAKPRKRGLSVGRIGIGTS